MNSFYSHSTQLNDWTFTADKLSELRQSVLQNSLKSLAKSRKLIKMICSKDPDYGFLEKVMDQELEVGEVEALDGPLITIEDQIIYTQYWESKIMNYCTVFNLDLTVQVIIKSKYCRQQPSFYSRDFSLKTLFLNTIQEYIS